MLISRFIKNILRLSLAVIIGLALVSSLPIPAYAADPVDLQLGGEGATSWSIGNIKPGDSGTKTVTLHNAGSKSGSVTIWIGDIVNSEGANPASETGNTSEPGELGNYLVLNLSGNGLSTNLILPAKIDNLPQSASAPNYIRISPLNAGDTISLDWQWELPASTGNDVQGDGLSFTINYLLEEFPQPPSGDEGLFVPTLSGDDSDSANYYLAVNILGTTSTIEIGSDGTFHDSHVLVSPDGSLILEIDRGTKLTSGDNKIPDRLEITLAEESIPLSGGIVISPVYDITAYVHNAVCSQAEFDPPIRVTLNYDSDELPENISSVFIARCDNEQGLSQLESAVSSTAGVSEIIAEINNLNLFAIVAKLAPMAHLPTPANFELSNLTINPDQVQPGQPVTISLTVTNSGSTTGTYELQTRIDGAIITVKEITLDPASSQTVSFEVFNLIAGEHQIEIAGLTRQFSILSPPSPAVKSATPATSIAIDLPLIGLIIAMVIITGSFALSLVKPELILAAARKLTLW
ncbi:hypothetical protein ACFLVH_03355 [Chloroflexota bacterium]